MESGEEGCRGPGGWGKEGRGGEVGLGEARRGEVR